ncbi:hypothetical protein [Vibrio phage RYC]|nr:hypothetical protein [Vibrio phage RYC]
MTPKNILIGVFVCLGITGCGDPIVKTEFIGQPYEVTRHESCFEEYETEVYYDTEPVYKNVKKSRYVTKNGKTVRETYYDRVKVGTKQVRKTRQVADYGQQEVRYSVQPVRYTHESGKVSESTKSTTIFEGECD